MLSKKVISMFFIFFVFASIGMFIGTLIFFDPYHIYYLPEKEPLYVDKWGSRKQDAAYIRHFEFDSFILGNSYMENTKVSDAESLFGGKFFNLSLSGSNNYERFIVLRDIFRRHKIKTAIILLSDNVNRGGDYISQWAFLYDRNPFNDIQLYTNSNTISFIIKCIIKNECKWGSKIDFDRPCSWITLPEHNSRLGNIANWGKYYNNNQLKELIEIRLPMNVELKPGKFTSPSKNEEKQIDSYLEETFFSIVRQHPETTFITYYNPHSRLYRAFQSRDGTLGVYAYWLRKTVELGKNYSNFKIYGFDNLPFTADMSRYKDLTHYDDKVNSEILHFIKNDIYQLSVNNIDEYIDELRKNAELFDIVEINKIIQEAKQETTKSENHKM